MRCDYPEDAKKGVKILWEAGFTYNMIYNTTGIKIKDIKRILKEI